MPADSPLFAALDYGTGGGKCVIFDATGKCRGVKREAWSYTPAPFPGESMNRGYAFDPDKFWQAVCRCARGAIAEAGVDAAAIKGVSTTAQRLGAVFLDSGGREIYAGPNMDGRGFAGALEIMATIEMERAIRISGHWPPFIFSLARLLWYRTVAEHPPVAHILTLNDWLAYRLSGALASEPSNACESLLLEVSRRRWSEEILETFRIDRELLPQVVEPGTQIGAVSRRAAEETGLVAGTPVVAGGGDTQCALLGSNVVEAGEAGAVLGTTSPVMVVTKAPEFDLKARLWTGCHVLCDRWTIESNAGDTGIGYEWWVEMLCGEGIEAFRRAEEAIAAVPGEPQGIYGLAGPQIFDLMNFNPSRPLGVLYRYPMFSQRPTRGSMLRAFIENVAFAIRANLEQIDAVRGKPATTLTLSGGMTRSPGLRAAFAKIVPTPLLVSEEANATALGAAVLAAACLGTYPSVAEAARAMVRRRPLPADEVNRDAYQAHYARWRELYASLQALSV